MIDIEQSLHDIQSSLCKKVELAGLLGRSHTAHKWKLTYRLLVLRESLAWRIVDILTQSHHLSKKEMIIGARILTRAAIESLCLLIYMNSQIKSLLENKISFNDFEKNTSKMLLGAKNFRESKDESPNIKELPEAINVNNLVDESNNIYKGMKYLYDDLSETAHPNYAGVLAGYSKLHEKIHTTEFGVFMNETFGDQHDSAIQFCIETFVTEYNHVWPERFSALEKWLEAKDNKLERQRRKKHKKYHLTK